MDRVQLADAIRKAYTFADTEEPAHVQHWETLANITEYLGCTLTPPTSPKTA